MGKQKRKKPQQREKVSLHGSAKDAAMRIFHTRKYTGASIVTGRMEQLMNVLVW